LNSEEHSLQKLGFHFVGRFQPRFPIFILNGDVLAEAVGMTPIHCMHCTRDGGSDRPSLGECGVSFNITAVVEFQDVPTNLKNIKDYYPKQDQKCHLSNKTTNHHNTPATCLSRWLRCWSLAHGDVGSGFGWMLHLASW